MEKEIKLKELKQEIAVLKEQMEKEWWQASKILEKIIEKVEEYGRIKES